jgi:hypothetical protein
MRRFPVKPRSILRWSCTTAAGAVVILWIAGIWTYGGFSCLPTFALYSGAGQLRIAWFDSSTRSPQPEHMGTTWECPHARAYGWWFQSDARTFFSGNLGAYTVRSIDIPHWLLAAALGIPAWLLWRKHLRERLSPSACRACGYECAGLPEGAACPECGGISDFTTEAPS